MKRNTVYSILDNEIEIYEIKRWRIEKKKKKQVLLIPGWKNLACLSASRILHFFFVLISSIISHP